MLQSSNRALWLLLLASGPMLSPAIGSAEEWRGVKVPEVWKKPPAGKDGYSWYRGFVQAPAEWQGKGLVLFVEPSDWAHEVYFNGQLVGSAGAFPPYFRSGLNSTDRFFIAADKVRFDRPNVVALRLCDNDGRAGFNLAAPVLFGAPQAIRMAGDWQFRAGDDPAWAKYDDTKTPDGTTLFARLDDATAVAASLKRIQEDEIGPLAPAEALKHFVVPDDLELQLAISEPEVRQPLSIKWDARGRLWVVQFIQYPDPAGLKMLSRDKFLRSVYDKVPPAPPNHFHGQDKITIHEDSDGDGRYDKHKTFVDGLSLISSMAFAKDGVWVLNPPYLLFYPDRNHDDVPDGDPEVHLSGFGIEDSHSIANSLRWGPDGWLYGVQGSTVTAAIQRPGDKNVITSMGQTVWRYHPTSRRYELFAEGGGNSFGLEFNAAGGAFSGHNGGNTRGFHFMQGAYLRKGFDKHGDLSNPYAFGYFDHMKHAKVPRFTHAFVIYEGNNLPAKYQGNLFGVGPLQSHVVRSEMTRDGSSYQTKDLDFPIATKDTWCRPVEIQVGPDGAIYVCDMYEQRIDHASHYQGRIDRERGRIWRLQAKGSRPLPPFDLRRLSSDDLIAQFDHPNKWQRQTALRVLADRNEPAVAPKLAAKLKGLKGQSALESLWTIHLLGGLNESAILDALDHSEPAVRAWTVRLACDGGQLSSELSQKLRLVAQREPSVDVRAQLAASAKRLPAGDALPIVRQLIPHDEDAKDVFVPLLVWWAIEAKAGSDRDQVVALFADADVWRRPLVREHLLERIMRRYAAAGARKDLLACAQLLRQAPNVESADLLLKGFEKAFEGRSLSGMPEELVAALAKAGGGSTALRLRQGDSAAASEALAAVGNPKAKKSERMQYIQILGEIGAESAVPVFMKLIASKDDVEVKAAAIGALQAFNDPQIAATIIQTYSQLPPELRDFAQSLLAMRKAWALALLEAIDGGAIEARAIPPDSIRRILFHRDDRIASLVKKHYGEIEGATSAELYAQIEKYKASIAASSGNPYAGKTLYIANCGKCHVLFNEGGRIGPDLTSFKRDDLHTMLVNVVNPSAQIREGYENYLVLTTDGRTLNGFIADQDARVVVIRSVDGQTTVVERSDIEAMSAIPRSIMPEGILKDYSEQQIRDLFAYLRSTQPLQAGRR